MRYLQLVEHLLGLGHPLELQPSEGDPVSGEHLEQPSSVRIVTRADQAETRAPLGQSGVTNQQGAQDVLTQVGLLSHDHSHLLDPNAQHAARCSDHGGQKDPLSGQETLLSEEFTGSVGDDQVLLWSPEVLEDVDLALEHDDQVIGLVAVGEEDIALLDLQFGSVATEHGQLCLTEKRSQLGRIGWRGERGRPTGLR
jgi:hypothetical protein